MTVVNENNNGDVQAVQMEAGEWQENEIPVAELVDDAPTTTHALTGSNRFVPVAVASLLPDHPPLSLSDDEEEEQRPDLLSATVYKQTQNSPVGIVLMDNANVGVTVKRIDPGGLFSNSSFQLCDRIMSVNSESCEGMDSKSVADLIRNAQHIVTVVVRAPNGRADRISSMVMKEAPNERVGIGFKKSGGKLIISSIAENGIFAHSLLNVSDVCLSINGIPCTFETDAETAAEVVHTSPSFVTITAKTSHATGVVVATSRTSEPTVASNTTAVNDSANSTATRLQEPTVDKRSCCAFVVVAFIVVVAAAAITSTRSKDDLYDNYSSSCTYVDCYVCSRNCYNLTSGNFDYCCTNETTYTCDDTCPGSNILCTICDMRWNETTYKHDYFCAEEYTYSYSNICPCTYMPCDGERVCGYNCYNITTLDFEYCCEENYVYTCTGSCSEGSTPTGWAPVSAPTDTSFLAPSPSPSSIRP